MERRGDTVNGAVVWQVQGVGGASIAWGTSSVHQRRRGCSYLAGEAEGWQRPLMGKACYAGVESRASAT